MRETNGYYAALIAFSILTLLILITMAKRNQAFTAATKRGFVLCAALIIIAAVCEFLGVLFNGGNVNLRIPHMLVKFIELSIAPVIPIVCGGAIYPIRRRLFVIIPLAVHTLIEFASMWVGITFYVNAANRYVHCDFYWIYYLTYAVCTAFMVVQIICFCYHYQNQNTVSLALILAFVLAGVVCQAVNDELRIVWLVVAVGNTLFYIYYSDLVQQVDSLTGLLNRRNYENRIESMLERAAIIFFDVDDFKAVNDNYGHQCGDDCLKAVGKALKRTFGKSGLCYRIGGDEFCVIMDRRISSVPRLNAALCELLDIKRRSLKYLPHVSYGYAVFEPRRMTPAEAVAAADQMMYEIKNSKRLSEKRGC